MESGEEVSVAGVSTGLHQPTLDAFASTSVSARDATERRSPLRSASPSDVQAIEDSDRYVHVRFADPVGSSDPDARLADHAADSVYRGTEVRTSRRRRGGWTQRVLVPKPVDYETAVAVARQVRQKIGE